MGAEECSIHNMPAILPLFFLLHIALVGSSCIFIQCGFSSGRPDWYDNVDDKFQEAQNLGPKITTTGYCPGKGYDLAHVLSWHNIAEPFLRTPFGYFEMMKRGSDDAKIAVEFMVDQLFEIDEDAYAPILKVKDGGDDDGNGEIVKSFEWEKHATLLRNGKLGK